MTEHWVRIRRRWWAIPLALAIAVAIVVPMSTDRTTTYSSKVALTTYSADRAPEQDAILIQSYVDFFNGGADMNELRSQAKVPADIAFSADPVATGPIMFIVATGDNEQDVRAAVTAMGTAFRNSINAGVDQARDNAIATLRKPFLDRLARKDFILEQEQIELSRQIGQLNADSSGRLQNLDNSITVSADRPRLLPPLSIAILVGLLAGVAMAWVLGGLAPRLSRRSDVSDTLGLRAFDVTSRNRTSRLLQMRHVVNALAFDDLPAPVVLAVTPVSSPDASGLVAEQLARIRAGQGADVVVVRTIRRGSGSAPGIVDVLRSPETVTLDDALTSNEGTDAIGRGVAVLAPGDPAIDPYDVMTRENVGELLGQLRKRFSVIVIDCPSVTTAGEVQLLCSAADRTVLVVERDVATRERALMATGLLSESQAEVFGAVLVAAPTRPRIGPLWKPSRRDRAWS